MFGEILKPKHMKFMKILFLFALLSPIISNAQKLKSFESSIEKTLGPITKKIPYTSVTSYLGYAASGSEDEKKDGKNFYYLYVWVPIVAPEIGVRMVSPANNFKSKKAILGASYDKNKSSKEYFDTYITLEKSNITSKDKFSEIKSATWTTLASNDDSSELPKQPSGNQYNSLLRYTSSTNNPTQALTRGLYRIGFTTYKTGDVNGTFLAQLGAPLKLPGVIVARSIEELISK